MLVQCRAVQSGMLSVHDSFHWCCTVSGFDLSQGYPRIRFDKMSLFCVFLVRIPTSYNQILLILGVFSAHQDNQDNQGNKVDQGDQVIRMIRIVKIVKMKTKETEETKETEKITKKKETK